jgi:hypothetical protein
MVATEVPLSRVVDLLGEPQQRLPIPYGADLPTSSFIYPGLTVYHFREEVVELYATDSRWQTPSGLRVGLIHEDLIGILGRVPRVTGRYDDPIAYEIPVCDQELSPEIWTAVYIVILLNDDGIITAISMEREWP